MVDPLEIAKYFIIRAYEDGREYQMTNMKVQKLLYYSQCLHLALYDEPLFSQEIQAWRYGPVCPPAYRFYSEFEAKQLPIPQQDKLETLTPEKKELLEEVWLYFGEYHAYYLSDMTHLEFPWKKARKGLSSYERSTNTIDLKDMKLLGEEKLLEIEKNHPHYQPTIRYLLKEAFKPEKTPQYIKKEEIDEWLESLLP
ncbi:unknown [Crocosphaera subtropica ATCC 51142]|uniref:Antitoxin SocA-like Panacea domain-containing protein n=1 Tax=Crocosphaera subtropica (strain ATCC 51142 / BH68) TaxID=43989 RepID=B1WTY7_CROS5|nr:type II toxin-antitoxin system antitoxin SocA domain-containing protein [Crocosphaera subtropica]ACB50453.1 unknown [Crocosphaera subtropica ATCC 51142]